MSSTKVLFVDLDGTLVHGDTSWLSLRKLLRIDLRYLLGGLRHIYRGRPFLKEYMARRWVPTRADLRWNPAVLDLIRTEKLNGTKIVLATGANEAIARAIVKALSDSDTAIDDSMGSTATVNLIGPNKLKAMMALNPGALYYVGDSPADLVIFEACEVAYLVRSSVRLKKHISHPSVVIVG